MYKYQTIFLRNKVSLLRTNLKDIKSPTKPRALAREVSERKDKKYTLSPDIKIAGELRS
jgi:hypothetical protein